MANDCESCRKNCCLNFKLTQELFDPVASAKILKNFPYIQKTGSTLVIAPGGHEMSVGVYNCHRFNKVRGVCQNYEMQERPPFCLQTGSNFFPHQGCLLKR